MTESGLLDRLLAISELFQKDMAREFEGTGLTTSRTHLLWTLRASGSSTQQAIAQAMQVSPRNVTALVDALEGAGYVNRMPHPTDRRAVLVALTALGTTTMATMERDYVELTAALVDSVAAADREPFSRGLDAILARLTELVDAARSPIAQNSKITRNSQPHGSTSAAAAAIQVEAQP